MTRDGKERMLTSNDEAATNNNEGKKETKKQARNTLKVVRTYKDFILGDAMSVKK